MTREELIKNLEYTMKKHENDRVDTFGTNISLMCKDMLDHLKQEPKWIPISERLPEENGRYIVFMNTKVFPIRILHFAKNLNEISLDFNCHSNIKKAGWYDYDSENGFFEWTGIEAWMPLPEPYKPESEDKE